MAEFLIPSGSKRISTLNQISGIPLASSSAIPIVLGTGSPITNGSTFQISHTDFLDSTVFNKSNTFTELNTFTIEQRIINNGVVTDLTGDGIIIREDTVSGPPTYGFRISSSAEEILFQDIIPPSNGNIFDTFLKVESNVGDISILRNTSIDGNLIVSGGITAQLINVNLVSSSIVYSSGSNIFGNTVSNTHQFTGSLRVSGSANVIGGFTQTSGVVSFGGAATFNNSITTFNQGINVLNQASSFFAGVNIGTSPQTRNLTHFGNYIHTGDVIQTGSISVNGNVIASSFTGSLNYTNLNNIPNGIVSSSTQINQYNIFATTGSNGFVGNQRINGDVVVTGSLIVSGSNTFTNIGRAEFTGSINVNGGVNVTQSITASIMSGSFVGDGSSLSGVTAADVDFVNVLNKPTLVSGSSQIDLTGTTNYVSGIKTRLNAETVVSSSQQIKTLLPTGTVSGSSQVSFNGIVDKPTLVSSSQQILDYGIFATTGSNNFVGNQIITGSLTVSGSNTFTNIGRTELTGSVEVDGDVGVYGNITSVQKTISVLGFPSEQPAFYSEGDILLSGSLSIHVEELGQSFDVAEQFQQAFSSISFTQGEIEIISSSYATTGSNTFIGNQTITGSLVLTGSLTSSRVLTDAVRFNTSAGVSVGVGELAWNNSDGTLDLGMKGGNVVQQIGQEIFYEVRNETGIQIPNGTAVFANGVTAGSGRITAAPYVADGSVREVRFLGIATEDISNGVNGFVTHFGYVRGLDTRGTTASSIAVGDETWAVGDILYVHPTVAGKLTNVKPEHAITVAIIITRHQSVGVLFVRPSTGGHLEDIHDILINTGSLTNGQVLAYNSTSGLWENTNSLSGSYQITGSLNVTGSLNIDNDVKIENGFSILTSVSQSLEFADDTAAAAGGVPLGGLYRSGSFIKIRIF